MKKIVYIVIVIFFLCLTAGTAEAASLSAPTYVSAFVYSRGSIRISWDNDVSNASGFTIQRSIDSGNFITLAKVPASNSTYSDTRITNGHIYTYRVFATSGSQLGNATESFPVEYLYPTGLSAEGISDSEIELTWTYPPSNKIPDSNYQTVIERRQDGTKTWQAVGTVMGTQQSFIDTDLTEAGRYYYRIRAVTPSSQAYLYYPNNTRGLYASTLLKAPAQIQAEILSTSSIRISWEDVSTKESGFKIERKKGNGSFVSLASLDKNETSYIDKTPVNGEQYTYRVTAVSSSFHGTPSEEITVPFLFPVSFEIADVYSTQMTLVWGYPGSGYVKPDNSCVLIERREGGTSAWEEIHITRPGETEYTDGGLQPGTKYYYRIRSRYNDTFTTEYFPSTTGISEYTKLDLSTHFYGYALSDTEIRLEWDRSAAGTSTVILEKIGDSGAYEIIANLTQKGSYIDTVEPGSLNTYRMKIRSKYIDSDYTPEIDVTAETLPNVKNLSIRSITPERVFLTWDYDQALESGFEVWRMALSEGIWKHIDTINRNTYMYSDEDIENGETYYYKVRAMKVNTIFSPFTAPVPVMISFSVPDGSLVISRDGDYLYLGWDDFSDMEENYIIEFKTSIYDAWHTRDTISKDMTMYRFIPQSGVDYTLRVRAFSKYPVYECYTNEVFYTTKIPAIPSLTDPTIVGSSRVVLKWVDLSDNEDEFVIYRKDDRLESEFKIIGTAEQNCTVFADDSVFPNGLYTYIVKSKNAAGESFPSNEITVKTPEKMEFSDLNSHPWAKDAIEALASMGIVEGDGNGHFNPSGSITRAEFIKLLVASFSLPESPIGSFIDVTPDKWYHRWIMTAYRNGIVEPDANGLFHPDAPIARQDIVYYASLTMKAAGLSLEQPPLYTIYSFSDYREITPYAQSAFAAMKYAGIINGIGNDRLGPLETATRAEAATIIHRMLQALEN